VSTVTSPIDSSEEDGSGWAGADFSGLNDPGALRQFLSSRNYLLEGFDSKDESHDPSQECFVCDGDLHEGTSNKNKGEHTTPDAVTHIATHIGGAAMPPTVGQSQP
jgi:hypothetical protein